MFRQVFKRLAIACVMTAAATFGQMTLISYAHAESSAVIELHKQMNDEVRAMESGLKELATETSYRREARKWSKQAKDLPRGSKDRAHAHANFALAAAKDLVQKSSAVTRTHSATSRLTETIDRLILAQTEASKGKGSLLHGTTKEEVRKKARQLQGVDHMFKGLLQSDTTAGNAEIKAAYQAFRIQMDSAIRLANLDRSTGLENLRKLRNTTQALAYLMRAYYKRLDYQRSVLETIAISGEADVVIREAETVVAEAFDILNPGNELNEDMDYVLQSMQPTESTALNQISYDDSMADRIGSAADYVSQDLP